MELPLLYFYVSSLISKGNISAFKENVIFGEVSHNLARDQSEMFSDEGEEISHRKCAAA